MSKIAVAQVPPVFLNCSETIEKAVELVSEAAAEGAELVVFPETFIPGYPMWMWRLRPGADMALTNELYGKLFENAVDLDVAGHYSRPDIFELRVNTRPQNPLEIGPFDQSP